MMHKRRRLGQHFLVSGTVARGMVGAAGITCKDTVFELGTGRGALTPLLCKEAARVISFEADSALAQEARSRLGGIPNLELEYGDGLGFGGSFDVFVSSVPYSQSRGVVEWLAGIRFSRGVIMVQKEFAQKLLAGRGRERRAISVVAAHCFEMERILDVKKSNFDPTPKVDSAVLFLRQKNVLGSGMIRAINSLFSHRRKTLRGILAGMGQGGGDGRRLDDLSAGEIVGMARGLGQ